MNRISHRYILEPYKGKNSRYTCPGCKKPFQFTRYIDTDTGETIASHVGKCNRINKCGYHYTPKQYFSENSISYPVLTHGDPYGQVRNFLPCQGEVSGGRRGFKGLIPPSYIDKTIFLKSLSAYENNNFVKYLHSRFNAEIVDQLINDYHIGTSSRWGGGTTIFWQVDIHGNIRTGKLMKYHPQSGKREKYKTNWSHSALGLHDFNLTQSFFGEHLLNKFPHNTIGIVESEKTALLASVFIPELLWIASGGANGINKEKIKGLRGREVILFPDASKTGNIYDTWNEIAKKYGFECSDFIEKNATKEQKAQGIDIADMFDFVTSKSKKIRKSKNTDPIKDCQEVDKLNVTMSSDGLLDTLLNEWETENLKYPIATPHIPYNAPSPVAIIDRKIKTTRVFEEENLVIKNRIFTTSTAVKIELVGIQDYGYCGNYDTHRRQNGYCRECILNCFHTIKINGKLQEREYTQLEILLMCL